jgi:ComF family protein
MSPLMDGAPLLVKTGVAIGGLARWPARCGRTLLDLLYPPLCLNCEAAVSAADGLCARCFRQLRPITAPMCPRLGLPFQISLGPDALSAEAIADPPPFDRVRSAVVYNDIARTLIARLKYGDRPELASFCGRLMVSAGAELWTAEPLLIPVPLHPIRQIGRRYNQSLELARVIAAATHLAIDPALVRRVRRTAQQVGLSAEARARNVAGAFAAHPDALARARGRPVVIVDDVVTTGSTVKAVTRALRKAGVERIDVISFARVVPGSDANDAPLAAGFAGAI